LPAGPLAFSVTDRARAAFVSVYLTDPDKGDVYAEIPWLAPGHTLPLTTTLNGGHYAFRCVFSDGTVRTSRRITITGTTSAAVAGYQPLPDLDMDAPVNAYRRRISAALPRLLSAARTLDADAARNDLPAARADWLTAHLDYERLGAAYNAFGDFDDAIDGTADGHPQGVKSPDWTGFFRIEYGLWHGQTASRLRALTKRLVSDVSSLIRDFPSEDIDPGDLPLRAHEILENTLQFQLTGDDDYGSGSELATVDANIQGTRQVLDVLEPLIRPRDPALLAVIHQDLSRVDAEVTAFRTPDGSWMPLRRISADRRRRIDGDMGELLEQLSAVPNLLAPRTSA
jgi:high-affinity iron transporter